MKILFVAFADSIHTARWMNQVADLGWDLHLFPSVDIGWSHEAFRNITIHHSIYYNSPWGKPHPGVKCEGLGIRAPVLRKPLHRYVKPLSVKLRQRRAAHHPDYRVVQLSQLIERIKPDIIHSLEFQHAAYLTLRARQAFVEDHPGQFPVWAVSDWGNDIYLFGRLQAHQNTIGQILSNCDYYFCECRRDQKAALELGLKGMPMPVFPISGGIDLDHVAQFRQPGPTSARKLILLKGYQDWHGRALFALRALALCEKELQGYQVSIYSAQNDVVLAAELLARDSGIPIEIVPLGSREEILRLQGQARIYIGNSISDGISTSMLEAMAMGAFPIQSCTACADEWIEDGVTGFIADPEEPQHIAAALRKALTDDDLVDQAAERNFRVIAERIDYNKIRNQTIRLYQSMLTKGHDQNRLPSA